MDGSVSGTIIDLTNLQVTDKFKLGLNAADYSMKAMSRYSELLYIPHLPFLMSLLLGLRGEYFDYKVDR
jgi:hypothetical protein